MTGKIFSLVTPILPCLLIRWSYLVYNNVYMKSTAPSAKVMPLLSVLSLCHLIDLL